MLCVAGSPPNPPLLASALYSSSMRFWTWPERPEIAARCSAVKPASRSTSKCYKCLSFVKQPAQSCWQIPAANPPAPWVMDSC